MTDFQEKNIHDSIKILRILKEAIMAIMMGLYVILVGYWTIHTGFIKKEAGRSYHESNETKQKNKCLHHTITQQRKCFCMCVRLLIQANNTTHTQLYRDMQWQLSSWENLSFTF